jgi:hypothetical protein
VIKATTREHTRYLGQHPWARKVVTLGFRGTYNDADAEIDAVALVGKQSVRFKSNLRLLVAGRRKDGPFCEKRDRVT